ncbi:hypothetical protein ACIQGA_33480, partial [[Kitasatospora] papulosa]
MQEERELAGVQAWNRRPYGDRTDQELTRLIATGPVDARREDKAAAAAEATERALQEQIAADRARGEIRGRQEVAPIYQLLDRADEQLAIARTEQAREAAMAAHAAKAGFVHVQQQRLSMSFGSGTSFVTSYGTCWPLVPGSGALMTRSASSLAARSAARVGDCRAAHFIVRARKPCSPSCTVCRIPGRSPATMS